MSARRIKPNIFIVTHARYCHLVQDSSDSHRKSSLAVIWPFPLQLIFSQIEPHINCYSRSTSSCAQSQRKHQQYCYALHGRNNMSDKTNCLVLVWKMVLRVKYSRKAVCNLVPKPQCLGLTLTRPSSGNVCCLRLAYSCDVLLTLSSFSLLILLFLCTYRAIATGPSGGPVMNLRSCMVRVSCIPALAGSFWPS